jgi:hypothetical protein
LRKGGNLVFGVLACGRLLLAAHAHAEHPHRQTQTEDTDTWVCMGWPTMVSGLVRNPKP